MIKDDSLTPDILNSIRNHSTELPHTGYYNTYHEAGTYLCRGCGIALFRSQGKFNAGCGWPSFDEAIPDHVLERKDIDGIRVEIICKNCFAHLGHVFSGEWLTEKNRRYCVNSCSLDFVSEDDVLETEEVIVAGGCFWGIEFYFKQFQGVLKTEVGYTGGHHPFPSYREVCSGLTGHVEAVRIVFDPKKVSYQAIIQHFFEIHDPTQVDGQGPDKGSQYRSVIFYYSVLQKEVSQKIIQSLKERHFNVVTRLIPADVFWPAELDHQNYYEKEGKKPYCHKYTKRFD